MYKRTMKELTIERTLFYIQPTTSKTVRCNTGLNELPKEI